MKSKIINARTASYIVFAAAALVTVLTFFNATRSFLYGVFGYAVYAYIPAAFLIAIMLFTGRKVAVSKGRAAVYVSLFFAAILILHVALSENLVGEADYLAATYSSRTVGGVLLGLPAALLHLIFPNYAFMLVAALIIAAALLFAAIYPLVSKLGGNKKQNAPFRPKRAEKSSDAYIAPTYTRREIIDTDSNAIDVTGMDTEIFRREVDTEGAPKARKISKGDARSILFDGEEPMTEEEKSNNFLKSFNISADSHPYTNQGILDFSDPDDYKKRYGGETETEIKTPAYDERREAAYERTAPRVEPSPASDEQPKGAWDRLYGKAAVEDDDVSVYRKEETRRPAAPVMPEKKRYDQYGFEIKEEPSAASAVTEPAQDMRDAGSFGTADTLYEAPEAPPAPDNISAPVRRPPERKPFEGSARDWLLKPMTDDEMRSGNIFSRVLEEEDKVTAAEVPVEEYTAPAEEDTMPPVIEVKAEPAAVTAPPPVKREKKPEFKSDALKKETAPVFPEQQAMFPEAPKKPYVPKPYKAPPYELLNDYGAAGSEFPSDYNEMKEKIEMTMQEFNVPAVVETAKRGPTFTMYYLKLGDGYKINKVTALKDNLKMRLRVKNLRILAPIEGEDAFGIELPNTKRDTVGLKTLLCSEEFNRDSSGIKIAMGKSFDGKPLIANLAKMPHLLVAGATGTGKSVFLNSVIISILFKYSPEDVRMIMIDPKRVEMSIYKGLPNLLVKEPVKESKHAANALKWLTEEMDRRYSFFEQVGCRDIDQYNDVFRDKATEPKMPKIVLIIDEMADLMVKSKNNNVEENIVRLAQLARACGIHMIIATQRPTAQVITGLIKANILHRVAFTVKSNLDSRVIMDDGGAEDLLGMGDMLYSFPANLLRLQGAFVDIQEIKAIVDYIKANNECDFDDAIMQSITYEPPAPQEEPAVSAQDARDASFEQQLRIILKTFILEGRASVSNAQAKHGVGYIKAKKIVDEMEARGFIGPQDGAKPREILITMDEFYDLFGTDMDAEGTPSMNGDSGGGDE